jgi:hypothetical protein
MGSFMNFILDDGPFAKLDRYVCTTPSFFL